MAGDLETLPARLRELRSHIRDEYLQPHLKPWIIGFSGGKDSTLLVQLVVEAILKVAPDERKRRVIILSNDTRVESPVYAAAVEDALVRLREGLPDGMGVEVHQTRPAEEATFWVNLLGKGYPAPNRNFRWCTDRMKIRPTTQFIRDQVCLSGEVILLLGVRRAESAARAQRIDAYSRAAGGARLVPHNDIPGCLIFRPIMCLEDEEVWHVLMNSRPPWGGNHHALYTLYRNANGGECPFVVSEDDAPSCGTGSARFGCWTCTVVRKDSSIDALVEAGHSYLEPLSEFRERIQEVSNQPEHREKVRRTGQPGLGPLTLAIRQTLLEELLRVQEEVNRLRRGSNEAAIELISAHEVRLVRAQWEHDRAEAVLKRHRAAGARQDRVVRAAAAPTPTPERV